MGSILGLSYLEAPSWVWAVCAVVVLVAGWVSIGRAVVAENMSGLREFCAGGLLMFGPVYGLGFLDAASGDGGWTPLGHGNWRLALNIAVLGLLLLMAQQRKEHLEQQRQLLRAARKAELDQSLAEARAASRAPVLSAADWQAWNDRREAMASMREGLPPCPVCGQATEAVTTSQGGIIFQPCGQEISIDYTSSP
ncbi:hypothetical protein ABZT43_48790 [Streptomyces sp. NPDC005349]|uniref:hypothetical protein n=1 Tax=Streptomyces sp. NPDC005349 TaxID=3157037 RepID=UPI0033B97663